MPCLVNEEKRIEHRQMYISFFKQTHVSVTMVWTGAFLESQISPFSKNNLIPFSTDHSQKKNMDKVVSHTYISMQQDRRYQQPIETKFSNIYHHW